MSEQFNIPQATANDVLIPNVVRSAAQLAAMFALEHIPPPQQQKPNFIIPQNTDNPPDPQLYLSFLGTPILIDCTFHGQTYQNEDGRSVTFPDITLVTLLITVSQSKNIVRTPITNRAGTIKEYLGLGDYKLTINAIITSNYVGSYPKVDVQAMTDMLNCTNPIVVTSWFLNFFAINAVVIDDYEVEQQAGEYSQQVISINATSDRTEGLRF